MYFSIVYELYEVDDLSDRKVKVTSIVSLQSHHTPKKHSHSTSQNTEVARLPLPRLYYVIFEFLCGFRVLKGYFRFTDVTQ